MAITEVADEHDGRLQAGLPKSDVAAEFYWERYSFSIAGSPAAEPGRLTPLCTSHEEPLRREGRCRAVDAPYRGEELAHHGRDQFQLNRSFDYTLGVVGAVQSSRFDQTEHRDLEQDFA